MLSHNADMTGTFRLLPCLKTQLFTQRLLGHGVGLIVWGGWCSARQQAQQEGGSLLISLASCLLECVYSLIDYLTKFATVRMAITGEAFLEAARRATDLLARNFLKVCLHSAVLLVC